MELIKFDFPSLNLVATLQGRIKLDSWSGPLFLGVLFALAFCPISAALFFGGLMPLALKFNSNFGMSSLYGIGTALPVLIFTGIIAFSVRSINEAFSNIKKFEKWARIITGVIFIGIGIYYTLLNVSHFLG